MSLFAFRDWHSTAIKLHEEGLSGRKIARALGMGKSQVNDFLAYYRENKEALSGKKSVNYLYWDLETSLMQGYFFDIWQVNIPISRVTKHSHLLSNSWAFNDDKPQGMRLTPEQVRTGDDYDIVVNTIEAINKADVIVTFNGKKFDVKKLNTRALYWGLPPIAYPKHIDLMQDAKRLFKFPSNSMQNISLYLGEEGKIATGGSRLWERCAEWEDYETCDNALKEMLEYGLQDIDATRDLHRRFLGWSKNTPNIGVISKSINEEELGLKCVHCGSNNVTMMDKVGYTAMSSFDLYRCGESSCQGVSRVNASGKNLVNYL